MKILVGSDFHANWEAMKAFFKELEEGYDDVYSLGDVIGYGANPAKCLHKWINDGGHHVHGNHEREVLLREFTAAVSDYLAIREEANKEPDPDIRGDMVHVPRLSLFFKYSQYDLVRSARSLLSPARLLDYWNFKSNKPFDMKCYKNSTYINWLYGRSYNKKTVYGHQLVHGCLFPWYLYQDQISYAPIKNDEDEKCFSSNTYTFNIEPKAEYENRVSYKTLLAELAFRKEHIVFTGHTHKPCIALSVNGQFYYFDYNHNETLQLDGLEVSFTDEGCFILVWDSSKLPDVVIWCNPGSVGYVRHKWYAPNASMVKYTRDGAVHKFEHLLRAYAWQKEVASYQKKLGYIHPKLVAAYERCLSHKN